MSNSQLAFPDLTIRGFRGFRHLEIPELGRVTLITGKNNTGKSSLLEGVRLVAQRAAPDVLNDILDGRGEYLPSGKEDSRPLDPVRDFHHSVLFHGFPSFDDDFTPIVIETSNRNSSMKVSLHAEWRDIDDGLQHPRVVENLRRGVQEVVPKVPVLVVRTQTGENVIRLENLGRLRNRLVRSERDRINCRIVNSNGTPVPLGTLWDRAILRDEEEEVVQALQIIEPSITSVRMIGGGERYRPEKTPYIRAGGVSRYVPLASFGDGVTRILTLILALLDARGGLLLIDEFENGLHHTAQLEAWRMIFQLAQRHSIQVFVTTHSWDTVEAFQAAAAESPEVGILLRLTRNRDDIIPTVLTEEKLQVIASRRIEVR